MSAAQDMAKHLEAYGFEEVRSFVWSRKSESGAVVVRTVTTDCGMMYSLSCLTHNTLMLQRLTLLLKADEVMAFLLHPSDFMESFTADVFSVLPERNRDECVRANRN